MKKTDFTTELMEDTNEQATKQMLNSEPTAKAQQKKEDLKSYCLHLKKETLLKLRNIAFEEDKTINEIILRAIAKEIK